MEPEWNGRQAFENSTYVGTDILICTSPCASINNFPFHLQQQLPLFYARPSPLICCLHIYTHPFRNFTRALKFFLFPASLLKSLYVAVTSCPCRCVLCVPVSNFSILYATGLTQWLWPPHRSSSKWAWPHLRIRNSYDGKATLVICKVCDPKAVVRPLLCVAHSNATFVSQRNSL